MIAQRIKCGLVFGTWGTALAILVATGRTTVFLRPEFVWTLGAAAVISFGFLFAALRWPMDLPVLRLGILLLPLLHIAASDQGALSSAVFRNRFIGQEIQLSANSTATAKPSMQTDSIPDQDINRAFAGDDTQAITPESQVTLLQLIRAPEHFQGKKITVLGLALKDRKLAEHFGPGHDTALYRFVVACCAADALPVTVAVTSDGPLDFARDQWVEVEGVFELIPHNGKTVPIITGARFKPVDPPADPYLY